LVSTARIFTNGGSQAVRLPKEFRFDTDEVCIRRIGDAIILFPKDAAWALLGEALGRADDDFMAERDQTSQPPKAAGRRSRR